MWIRFLPYIIGAALIIGLVLLVNHWRVEAGKVDGLETKISTMQLEAVAYQVKLDAQNARAKVRISTNIKRKENQTTSTLTLRSDLAKSPDIAIPADKLQAIRNADAVNPVP